MTLHRRAHAERRRQRAGGAFRIADQGGVKLVKTYTLKRGAYDIARAPRGRQHRHGAGVAAAVPAAGARRQQAAGRIVFYSTFTGPAVYTEAKKFQKVEFKRHREEQGRHREAVDQRLGGDGAALLRQRLAPARRHQARHVRAQGRHQPVRGRHDRCRWARWRPAPRKAVDATFFAGPQEEKMLEAMAPGLDLVKDYGMLHHHRQAAVLAAGQAAQAARATGAGRSSRWWC